MQLERVLDVVFGSGEHGCLGKTVAFLELNKVFIEVFRSFLRHAAACFSQRVGYIPTSSTYTKIIVSPFPSDLDGTYKPV